MPFNIDPSAVLAVVIIGGGAVLIVRMVADFARRRVQKRTREILTSTRTKSRPARAQSGAKSDAKTTAESVE